MNYKLTFLKSAEKEWKKLAHDVREQILRKFKERLASPRVQSSSLRGMKDCYKIKLKKLGYRVIYRVYDNRLVIQVIAIGKREGEEVYKTAKERLH